MIAYDAGDLWHVAEHFRVDLRGASGDDDRRIGVVFGSFADGVAGGGDGGISDGAGVDDDGAFEPSGFGMAAHDFGLIGVEPTAKGYEFGRSLDHRVCDVALL